MEVSKESGETLIQASKNNLKALELKAGIVGAGVGASIGAVVGLGIGAAVGATVGGTIGTIVGRGLRRLGNEDLNRI